MIRRTHLFQLPVSPPPSPLPSSGDASIADSYFRDPQFGLFMLIIDAMMR
jgi:hypothetical protein